MKIVGSLTDQLHGEVATMNRENFIVRMHLEAVNRFRERKAWEQLSDSDVETLRLEIAGLPNEIKKDDIESRMFDLTALRMQLALAEGNETVFESHRRLVVEIAMLLEEKSTIPGGEGSARAIWLPCRRPLSGKESFSVASRICGYGCGGLVPFLDKKKRKIVYTNFQDEVVDIREERALYMPKMTGAQYEKRVKDYLRNHLDHLVVHRLRTNQPADRCRLERAGIDLGRDRRRGRGNAVFRASCAQRVAIARSFREEPGGVGSNGCAGRVLGFSGRQEPHTPPDPLC